MIDIVIHPSCEANNVLADIIVVKLLSMLYSEPTRCEHILLFQQVGKLRPGQQSYDRCELQDKVQRHIYEISRSW